MCRTCFNVLQTKAGQIIHNLLNVLGRDEHYMVMEHNQELVLIRKTSEIRTGSSLVNKRAVRWKTALKRGNI